MTTVNALACPYFRRFYTNNKCIGKSLSKNQAINGLKKKTVTEKLISLYT